jgi:hypothetical protein
MGQESDKSQTPVSHTEQLLKICTNLNQFRENSKLKTHSHKETKRPKIKKIKGKRHFAPMIYQRPGDIPPNIPKFRYDPPELAKCVAKNTICSFTRLFGWKVDHVYQK